MLIVNMKMRLKTKKASEDKLLCPVCNLADIATTTTNNNNS